VGLALLGVPFDSVRPLLWALDGAFALAFLVDRLRTPNPTRLTMGRSLPERAGLTVPFKRVVELSIATPLGLGVELREEFSEHFEVVERTLAGHPKSPPAADDPTGGPDSGRLEDGRARFVRSYRGLRRGVQRVGGMRVRLTGPLGLVQRQAQLFGTQEISIEPALANLDATLRLAASERWHDLGVRRLRRSGGQSEFESLRDYVRGDDPRLIDWKAFARRGRPIVREYREERGQELIILVDAGRRMAATTATDARRGWTKLDHALDGALELAAVALQAGDRVGLALFDRNLRLFVPPTRGKRQFRKLREAVFAELPSSLDTDLARALREVSVLHRRRATLVVISDVADPFSVPRQAAALSAGSRRHRCILATLDDPALRAVLAGESDARPAERAAAFLIEEERRVALGLLRQSGARVLDSLPAEAAGGLLSAWLDARRGGPARISS
jgi:uncharacterized protein (DUF58 family)